MINLLFYKKFKIGDIIIYTATKKIISVFKLIYKKLFLFFVKIILTIIYMNVIIFILINMNKRELIMNESEYIAILKALADPTRLQIFHMLKGVTICGYKILDKLNVTQPTLSHHMKILCEANLVKAEKDWKWTYYTQNAEVYNSFIYYLKGLCDR